MPLPYALFVAFADEDDQDPPSPCGEISVKPWNCSMDKLCRNPLHILLNLPWAYLIAAWTVYLWVPITDIYWGMKNLLCHEKYEEDEHADMPVYKLFEQFGEAIPQFAIAVTFYANNAHWLPPADLYFGIFTMIMSAGSILMGIGSGCWVCLTKCYEDDL